MATKNNWGPHTPQREIATNPFNKNKFKGNYEKITDSDLDTELWVLEPISLASLVTQDQFLYQQIWSRYNNGGRLFISLVPYKEEPKIRVKVTSRAGDFTGLERDDIISAFTNAKIGTRPTKRFYINIDPSNLVLDEDGLIVFEDNPGLVIYEENNYVEILNNDDTIKQYGLTLEKVKFWEGGEDSFYRTVSFYYENYAWRDAKKVSLSTDKKSLIGSVAIKSLDNKIQEFMSYDIVKETILEGETEPKYYETKFYTLDNEGNITQEKNKINPTFAVPLVTDNGVKWMFPWVWEYLYAKAQFDGEYKWDIVEGGSSTSNKPDNSISGSNTFSGSEPEYREVKGNTALEVGSDALDFMLPYSVEWGLPKGLSSHGATYISTESGESATGLLGLGYDSSSLNGARPWSVKGSWAANTLLFALDNAYDPTVLTILEKIKMFISRIEYGAFYQSERYYDLIIEVLRGSAIYQGTAFMSDIGVLKDIENKSVDDDIRKWKQDNDWMMLLTSGDTIELSDNIAYDVAEGPSYPKIKTGLLDFKGMQIRTNDTRPFNKLYTSEPYWDQEENFGVTATVEDTGIGEIDFPVSTRGNEILILHTESKLDAFILKIPGEIKEGRSLSGGTKFTFL